MIALKCTGTLVSIYISYLLNLKEIVLDEFILLTEWKQEGENVRDELIVPVFHIWICIHISLFLRFNG